LRADGKTEVLVDETVSVSSYVLVEELIDFGTAIDDRDYVRAMKILEGMEYTSQAEVSERAGAERNGRESEQLSSN
jgi:intraflagellar transport protein 172